MNKRKSTERNEKKSLIINRDTGFLIITKSKQAEKVKEMLDKEKIDYETYDKKKLEFLSKLAKKFSSQEEKEIQETEQILSSFNKARIKYSKINVFLRWKKAKVGK